MIARLAGLLLSLPFVAVAADLGTWGDLYPVAEPDLLTTIDNRLRAMEDSGELAQAQDAFKARVIKNSLRPAPAGGLTVAREDRTHYIDPSFVVSQDLADPQGRVFARQGEQHNPLTLVPFGQTLYFIDADDPRQLHWMQQQQSATRQYKVILVRGDIRDSTRLLATRIYFDQQGVMSRKFQLTTVPARVTAAEDGLRLRVDTFAMTGVP